MTFGWIAFLTDYGRSDGFVAACHGVIARIAPDVRVIDVTHDVPPHDVRHGAVVLVQTVPYLPPSVVVAVVDPGVGTSRRPVALVTGAHILVGPDNGLLGWAADVCGGVNQAVELTSARHRLTTGAVTFDGRDVFAPAAAHLATGVDVSALGPELPVDSLERLPQPLRNAWPGGIESEVLIIDHFGNVALAAHPADLETAGLADATSLRLSVGERSWLVHRGRSFADVEAGELVVFVDSSGQLALAVNQGRADDELDVRPGDEVVLGLAHQGGPS